MGEASLPGVFYFALIFVEFPKKSEYFSNFKTIGVTIPSLNNKNMRAKQVSDIMITDRVAG